MHESEPTPLSPEELAAEAATPLPRKEVMSLLDLNADINAALDLAAPIDLAVAANANVAAPIEAAVGANVLSVDSQVGSLADQAVGIHQDLTGTAIAHSPQDSTIDQAGQPADGGTAPTGTDAGATTGTDAGATTGTDAGATTGTDAGATTGTDAGSTDPAQLLDGNLLNVNVNAAIDAKLAAPVDGAVAANANAAAPIDASVGANIASVGSEATSVASQQAIIDQHLDGTAQATADQTSSIQQ